MIYYGEDYDLVSEWCDADERIRVYHEILAPEKGFIKIMFYQNKINCNKHFIKLKWISKNRRNENEYIFGCSVWNFLDSALEGRWGTISFLGNLSFRDEYSKKGFIIFNSNGSVFSCYLFLKRNFKIGCDYAYL